MTWFAVTSQKVDDWLTNWQTDTLTHWLTDTLNHWLTDTMTHWHTDLLTHWLTDPLTHWRTDSLTHWHTDTLTHWLTDSLKHTDTLTHWHWLTHWLTVTLTSWLTTSLTHWHTDSLTHWLTDTLTHRQTAGLPTPFNLCTAGKVIGLASPSPPYMEVDKQESNWSTCCREHISPTLHFINGVYLAQYWSFWASRFHCGVLCMIPCVLKDFGGCAN